ncbi:MAG: (E)-4-hydroxy-3-methylbut-2-enyl-diphosphate synthase [Spirochaetota bacterium]
MHDKYNHSPFSYQRMTTREVMVGGVGVGGKNPIRIQSMTTSDTQDVEATVAQVLELERAGCEIVRITVPSLADAKAMQEIRQKLISLRSKVPLVADIHFTPRVAMQVVEWVDKVRINPGNFADKKKFAVLEYSDEEYALELERIAESFLPLVKRCKELGVAMRIGTNHGSLSDRIMNRYGDTPLGMCESALEFIKIAESESYQDIIVSMKSSNPQVMVQTYRMLSAKFLQLGMNYPFHLGVTEAGYGREGRIKSSVGIGSLLEDGLGDTIRVSLTEDAVKEIPVARWIAEKYNHKRTEAKIESEEFCNPYEYRRFANEPVFLSQTKLGEGALVRVELGVSKLAERYTDVLRFAKAHSQRSDNRNIESLHLQLTRKEELTLVQKIRQELPEVLLSLEFTGELSNCEIEYSEHLVGIEKLVLRQSSLETIEKLSQVHRNLVFELCLSSEAELPAGLKDASYPILLSLASGEEILKGYRKLLSKTKDLQVPYLLAAQVDDLEIGLYESSIGIGGLLIDGFGDMVRLQIDTLLEEEWVEIIYDILQASRLRTTKTEFISCPSCGRTLFDLQDTTSRIKSKTGHLKGVKIAVMGCIVNGPGEMADADFGYVGAGPGKIHLYKGKEIVKKSIPSAVADEELISLIRDNGMWIDP